MRTELTGAVATLIATTAEEVTELGSILVYVQGQPDLIAAAVQKALDAAGVDEVTAAAQIEQARSDAKSSVDAVLAAVVANTPSAPEPTA